MEQSEIIKKTIIFVKKTLENMDGSHDWWHIYRVWNLSKNIANSENCENMFVIELGALLHDIADAKYHNNDEEMGSKVARTFLSNLNVDEKTIKHVEQIILNISFKGGTHKQEFRSNELDIIQDADRLDAIGAIGIARAFTYGGFKKMIMYNPKCKPKLNMSTEEYRNNKGTIVNHFYEKLLLLKNIMNTESGRKIAEHRHQIMVEYLKEFYNEFEGKV